MFRACLSLVVFVPLMGCGDALSNNQKKRGAKEDVAPQAAQRILDQIESGEVGTSTDHADVVWVDVDEILDHDHCLATRDWLTTREAATLADAGIELDDLLYDTTAAEATCTLTATSHLRFLVTGPPTPGDCGNGYVDIGEQCDPGWSGSRSCSDNCEWIQAAPSGADGCESLIEADFAEADIAWIPAADWENIGAQVLEARTVEPWINIVPETCHTIVAPQVQATCERYELAVPIVDRCQASTSWSPTGCRALFQLDVSGIDPALGIVNTDLDVILQLELPVGLHGAPR